MVAPPTRCGTMTTKAELRSLLRKRRAAFQATHSQPFPLHEQLRTIIAGSACIGSYWAIGSEPDMIAINQFAAETDVMLSLPRVDGRGTTMAFHVWLPGDPLETAAFGFAQPLASAPIVTPTLLLIPMLGFDRAMQRIGQGAGHYDRYTARFPLARKVGIAWSVQEAAQLATDPWDVPMDAICTEKEWICPTPVIA